MKRRHALLPVHTVYLDPLQLAARAAWHITQGSLAHAHDGFSRASQLAKDHRFYGELHDVHLIAALMLDNDPTQQRYHLDCAKGPCRNNLVKREGRGARLARRERAAPGAYPSVCEEAA